MFGFIASFLMGGGVFGVFGGVEAENLFEVWERGERFAEEEVTGVGYSEGMEGGDIWRSLVLVLGEGGYEEVIFLRGQGEGECEMSVAEGGEWENFFEGVSFMELRGWKSCEGVWNEGRDGKSLFVSEEVGGVSGVWGFGGGVQGEEQRKYFGSGVGVLGDEGEGVVLVYTRKPVGGWGGKGYIFMGDVLFGRGVSYKFGREGGREALVEEILSYTKGMPLIVNLEGVVREKCLPMHKLGTYELCMERDWVKEMIRELNIVAVSTANNHRYDYGKEGYVEMVDFLEGEGLVVVEDGEWVDMGKFYLAALTDLDNLAVPRFDRLIEEGDLVFLEEIPDDKPLFMMVHWGNEYKEKMNWRTEELEKSFKEKGVEVVVGSHSHRRGEYGCEEGFCTIFSLGNGVFDQPWDYTSGQMMKVIFWGDKKGYALEMWEHMNFFQDLHW